MNFKLLASILIFSLSAVTGGTIMYASQILNKETPVTETTGDQSKLSNFSIDVFTRTVRVTAFDPESQLVEAITTDRTIGGQQGIIFRLTDSTTFQRQNPVFENNIVIGTTPVDFASVDEIEVGGEIIIRIRTQEDGSFVASDVVFGDPFPLP